MSSPVHSDSYALGDAATCADDAQPGGFPSKVVLGVRSLARMDRCTGRERLRLCEAATVLSTQFSYSRRRAQRYTRNSHRSA